MAGTTSIVKSKQTAAERSVVEAACKAKLRVLVEPITAAARGRGYAVAAHGSLARDIDLIAVPWSVEATDAGRLIEALRTAVAEAYGRCVTLGEPSRQPHGRLSVVLATNGDGYYLDLSVMPLGSTAACAGTNTETATCQRPAEETDE